MLYYHIYNHTVSAFTTTYIDIWLCGQQLPTLDYLIEGTVDNRTGYGDQQTADRMREDFELAKKTGFTHADTSMLNRAAKACIGWQHYPDPEDSYCEPGFHLSTSLPRIEGGLKLVRRLERMWKKLFPAHVRPFKDPERLVEVLKRLRAVELIVLDLHGRLYCSKERLPRARKPVEPETVIPQGNEVRC